MKKIIASFFYLLICITLYAHDFHVIHDTNLYDGSTYKILTSIRKGTVIQVEKFGTGWVYTDDKNDEPVSAVEISYKSFTGYIPLKDIALKDNPIVPPELNGTEWIPAYELDVLFSGERKNLEYYAGFYRQYDEWMHYTDWRNDDWYSSHSCPVFAFINSVISIRSFNIFNGNISNLVANAGNGEIYVNCAESNNSKYNYKIPDYFTDVFKSGKSYNLKYKIDGDYLYLTVENKVKYVLVKMQPKYYDTFYRFYGDTITEEYYSNIIWPRHADGTCDYEGKEDYILKHATANLRLRRSEDTSSTIITTMQKGTAVRILEIGNKDTIEGIPSNWVKVEVQPGARDRDGNAIKSGTIGWCFGGYLDPKP